MENFSGYLFKYTHKGLLKYYRKRYFTIAENDDKIYYYDSSEKKKLYGSIDIKDILDFNISKEKSYNSNSVYGFEITLPGIVYYLYSNKEEERIYWIEVITNRSSKLKFKKLEKRFKNDSNNYGPPTPSSLSIIAPLSTNMTSSSSLDSNHSSVNLSPLIISEFEMNKYNNFKFIKLINKYNQIKKNETSIKQNYLIQKINLDNNLINHLINNCRENNELLSKIKSTLNDIYQFQSKYFEIDKKINNIKSVIKYLKKNNQIEGNDSYNNIEIILNLINLDLLYNNNININDLKISKSQFKNDINNHLIKSYNFNYLGISNILDEYEIQLNNLNLKLLNLNSNVIFQNNNIKENINLIEIKLNNLFESYLNNQSDSTSEIQSSEVDSKNEIVNEIKVVLKEFQSNIDVIIEQYSKKMYDLNSNINYFKEIEDDYYKLNIDNLKSIEKYIIINQGNSKSMNNILITMDSFLKDLINYYNLHLNYFNNYYKKYLIHLLYKYRLINNKINDKDDNKLNNNKKNNNDNQKKNNHNNYKNKEKKLLNQDNIKKNYNKGNEIIIEEDNIIDNQIIINNIINELKLKNFIIPSNFNKISNEKYQFGTKVINLVVQRNKLFVRIGGGYIDFEDYISRCGEIEEKKIKIKPVPQIEIKNKFNNTLYKNN